MWCPLLLLGLASLTMAMPYSNVSLPNALEARQTSSFTDYLFVYFTGEGKADGERIYMSVSNNNSPASWTQVNGGNSILTSNVGTKGVRDPSIIRSVDGKKFWIIATDLYVYSSHTYDTENGSKSLVVWESSDLKNWSAARLAQISPSNAGMTWAPDAIWDPSRNQYLVFWTCNLKGDGWYIMKSYTSDFKTFSAAEKFLTGAGMDATIALDKSTNTFYRISKNGPGELIEEASATSLNGPWKVVSQQIGLNTIPKGEGPLIFQDNASPSKWHVFIDDYTRGRGYAPFETTNIAGGKWAASTGFSLPPGNRHGYIIGITAAERSCVTGGACSSNSGTVTTVGSNPPATTTVSNPSGANQTPYGQCGGMSYFNIGPAWVLRKTQGQGWSGPTICASGWTCKYSNDCYSQCVQ
ncbi:endo--beta-xylanase [Moniliophthora roreri]|nr:endo--beta-xylanase [Moniliophthora roreri]